MKKSKKIQVILVLTMLLIFISACNSNNKVIEDNGKVKIVATLFPQYDFTKEIVKDKGDVILLLPPGVEAHSFEPTPKDIDNIRDADIFLYTGKYMEPWAEKIVKNIGDGNIIAIDLSKGIELLDEEDHDDDHHGGKDPHIWLDPTNAEKMVDDIVEAVVKADGKNEDFYRENAENYKKKLDELDKKFVETFEKTEHHTIIYGGHFAFGYFIKRYGLDYISPYNGFTPNAEPSPKKITELMDNMKRLGINTIYYEELIDPKVARVISEQTGAKMLLLHGAHNISKEELESNVSYIDIMEGNLERLKQGLGYNE
jgi:zinc transport system substrate-binding protein